MNHSNKPKSQNDDFSDLWDLTKNYIPSESEKNDAAWNALKAKIEAQTQPLDKPSPTLTVVYRRILSYAAVVALFILAGYMYFQPQKTIPLAQVIEQTSANQIRLINLPDGSTVTLAANSKLTYSLSESQRKFELIGHAQFEVARNENAPFTVASQSTQVTVLGTGFDVDAYPGSDVKVYVNHGKVKVENESEEVILTKNQGIISGNNGLKDWSLKNNPVSFHKEFVKFDEAPLDLVIETLKNTQNIQLTTNSSNLQDTKFTGTLKYNQNPDDIAMLLSTALQIEVSSAK